MKIKHWDCVLGLTLTLFGKVTFKSNIPKKTILIQKNANQNTFTLIFLKSRLTKRFSYLKNTFKSNCI